MRELADSTEKAQLEWMSTSAISSYVPTGYNPALNGTTEGTGTIGGYDKSKLKTYIDTTVWNSIPAAWQEVIKETKIVSSIYNTEGERIENEVTTAKLRIPSLGELVAPTTYPAYLRETEGPTYTEFATCHINLCKRASAVGAINGGYTESWATYWTRTPYNTSACVTISSNGVSNSPVNTSSNKIVLAFST